MAAVFIYTKLWAGRTFFLVTIGFVGVDVFVFVNIIFVVVVGQLEKIRLYGWQFSSRL